ncbi:MAG: dihydroorotate dehydrogenase electron transfer subunit [Caldiserica bacterium]|nr:dihydroorotate dehydrogenase electron transfer subunit [Caldisericota bacterium]
MEWNLTVTGNTPLNSSHFLLEIEIPSSFPPPRPGQFIHIKTGEPPGFLLRRPFSIFSYQSEKRKIEVFYRIVGRGTKVLSEKKKGEQINLLGPLGNYFSWDNKTVPLLVGGGRGIAPLHFLYQEMKSNGIEPYVLFGFKNEEDTVFREKFFPERFFLCTEDGSAGEKGKVTDILKKHLPYLQEKINKIFSCGAKEMLKEIYLMAKEKKIACEVSFEQFMGCGIGICQGCVVKTKQGYRRICREGPVFNADEIAWE